MTAQTPPTKTYAQLKTHLLSLPPPLSPPTKPHNTSLTDPITSLQLHPTLEALLHILNLDLPSAHFLARHMQSAPAVEGMYIHGLLHRVEGDYDNTRAWYFDVYTSPAFVSVWGEATEAEEKEVEGIQEEGGKKMPAQRKAREWVDRVEGFVRRKEGVRGDLEKESRREIESLLDWCERSFGTERVVDASSVWVRPSQEIKDIGNNMTTGGEGYRKF